MSKQSCPLCPQQVRVGGLQCGDGSEGSPRGPLCGVRARAGGQRAGGHFRCSRQQSHQLQACHVSDSKATGLSFRMLPDVWTHMRHHAPGLGCLLTGRSSLMHPAGLLEVSCISVERARLTRACRRQASYPLVRLLLGEVSVPFTTPEEIPGSTAAKERSHCVPTPT